MKKVISILIGIMLAISVSFPAAAVSTNQDDNYFGKYSSPVVVKIAIPTNSAVDFQNGDTYSDNVFTRSWKSDLNIEVKKMWEAVDATGSYQTKLDLAIASNDLPDIMILKNYSEFDKLQRNGRLENLTSYYKDYMYPVAKQFCAGQDSGQALSWFQVKGKQYGMPNGGINFDSPRMVFVRHDWFVQSGLKAPKTIEDVIAIAKAFRNQDPKNRFGLALSKKVLDDSMCDITGICNSVGAYPRIWLDNGKGKLIYGTIQPQMKKSLQFYADMYKQGLIDPAFASIDGNKVGEQLTSGKVGVIIGNFWLPTWPLNSLYDQSGVDWDIFPLPVSKDNKAGLKVQTFTPQGTGFVVRKGFSHPEALFKIANFNTSKMWDPAKADVKKFDQYQMQNPIPIGYGPARTNMDRAAELAVAVPKKDPSKLKLTQSKGDYDSLMKYFAAIKAKKKPDVADWVTMKLFYGSNAAFNIERSYYLRGQYLTSKLIGYQSPEMERQWNNLNQLEEIFITQVISGTKSVDDFDQFVSDWRKAGGEKVESEVNDWYSSHK